MRLMHLRSSNILFSKLSGRTLFNSICRNMSEGKNIFEKIIDREIPASFLHEDEESVVFKDINPQAPVHFLVVPKKCYPKLEVMDDPGLMGRLMMVANKVAKEQGLVKGYRVVINNGDEGGQEVPHLHIHVLGGKQLKWPPC
ncbi:HINT1 [Lepeophtheirus salmonis]|uniref:HINT1 n=1 Tax=Lepeophtheirus salmonis TaxID=72036 RepID=A0A7R8D987_LEPSM|nr:histidine triad nucleotide-binding protein 1-like [Lepeophtheirus salmonis]CAB4070295.1 HINT1 [Lepeophtheirus salmonis]CAF3043185.1 HINT1 [Lepeophtheirus salmonis]